MSLAVRGRQGIERYDPGQRPALIEFRDRMYDLATVQAGARHLAWLFEEHPLGRGSGILVCRRDGRIVGQQGAIPFVLHAGGRDAPANWAVDLMVDPAWRLKGIGPALTSSLIAEGGVVAALDISDAAYRSFLRSGWRDLGEIPRYVRPIVPARPRPRSPRAALDSLAQFLAGPLLRPLEWPPRFGGWLGGVRVVEADRFDSRIDDLWQRLDHTGVILARRDLAALRWRFDACPDADACHRLLLVAGGEVVGYAVLCAEGRRGARRGAVLDHLCEPRWYPLLFAACVGRLRTLGVTKAVCLTRGRVAEAALRRLGFLRRGRGPRLMVHVGADTPDADLMVDPDAWCVTMADSDIGLHDPTSR